ncbi:hypothetical protein BK771_03765 [Bacillus thuringiensis serovar ostriniae]|nr:hypothetical protein BK771_03765 [Bacillus thuringiensis serovar ostriniae]
MERSNGRILTKALFGRGGFMKNKDKVSAGWWTLAMSLRMLVKKDGIEREEIEEKIKELIDYFYHQ